MRDGTLYGASFSRQKARRSGSVDGLPGAQHDPRLHRLALDVVGHAGDADFGDRRMRREHFLDLARPDLVAARLDQVLLAIDDEEVAVVVEIAEIAGVQLPTVPPPSPSSST